MAAMSTVSRQPALSLFEGSWDVRTLLPGRTAIPPSHAVVVSGRSITLSEVETGPLYRFATSVGERLRVVHTRVPELATSVCRFPGNGSWPNISAVISAEGSELHEGCNAALLSELVDGTVSSLSAVYYRRFPSPLPLYVASSSALTEDMRCGRLPWFVQALSVQRTSADRLLMSLHLLQEHSDASKEPCLALFQLSRVQRIPEKDLRSLVGPVVLLLLVMAVRMLPRFVLQRTGHISADTFRGRGRPSLTPEQRDELQRRQRAIIEQMKREDGRLPGNS